MRFLKHIRSKSKVQAQAPEAQVYHHHGASPWNGQSAAAGGRGLPHGLAARLPSKVLHFIFLYVCPHAEDRSYATAEDSMTEDGCMLCDMRDLAHCALVCRRWNEQAQRLLYHSVRIDAVHYCDLEAELAEKRKHRSFFERNADPRDPPRQRLSLFCRTVRARDDLARLVVSLKVAYMTREAAKADLARTVSVLPNLQHVDLPEGFYSDDAMCATLRNELQARCPDVRKMKYAGGAEQSFAALITRRHWLSLEVVELVNLNVEPATLVHVLASLPILHELKLASLPWVDDTIFDIAIPPSSAPAFPPLQRLSLEDTPHITASGLVNYLGRPETREVFASLSLLNTGVLPSALHAILARAPHLEELSIIETVSKSFPTSTTTSLDSSATPPLASRSLVSLHYEITSASSSSTSTSVSPGHSLLPQRQQPAASYYSYLVQSLHANALPALQALYVRDADFPEMLVLEPPRPAFAHDESDHAGAGGFNQQLAVYSKGLDELEWNFTCVSPPAGPGRRGSYTAQRPISAYKLVEAGHSFAGLNLGDVPTNTGLRPASSYAGGSGMAGDRSSLLPPPRWSMTSEARKSIIVGNGFGGFLAVPANEFGGSAAGAAATAGNGGDSRPGSSGSWRAGLGLGAGSGTGGHKRGGGGSRHDLWR